MIRLSQERTKTLLAIHGWSGILLGLLLYAVILTGMIAVFADDIGDWSSPTAQHTPLAFPPGLNAKLSELAATVEPQYREELSLFPRAGGRIHAFFHHHVTPEGASEAEEQGVLFVLHPQTLAVLDRREGFAEDIAAFDVHNALADFLVELHVSLHIPEPWGFLVTGILGLAMMVAVVTGFIVHRHLLKELFTIRRLREALLARRDAHVIAASWSLPFAFVLAFTGSYYSLATSVGLPGMAMVAFGGDREAMFETLVGLPPPENRALVPPANLDAMLDDARARTNREPVFAAISHYGRADSQFTVFSYPTEGQLFNHTLVYEAASGAFIREKPGFGLVPSAGGTAVDLMAPLHFGTFAGVLSKSVWFVLGFALTYVSLTGLLLWTTRRAESPLWRRMERIVIWMGYGLPLALALVPHGYFVAHAMGAAVMEPPLVATFFLGTALATLIAVLRRDPQHARRWLLSATGLALALLPVVRLLSDGPGWLEALQSSRMAVFALDVTLLLGGVICLYSARRSQQPTSRSSAGEQSEVAA